MIPSFVGLHGRLEGIIARWLRAVRGSEPQMQMTGAAEFVICDYAIIVTFRDRSRKSSFAIPSDRISKPGQESAPRKVTMNHITRHKSDLPNVSSG